MTCYNRYLTVLDRKKFQGQCFNFTFSVYIIHYFIKVKNNLQCYECAYLSKLGVDSIKSVLLIALYT